MASSYFLSIFAVMSDAMKPGAMALQVMLRPLNSLATVFDRPIKPACMQAYRLRGLSPSLRSEASCRRTLAAE